MNILLVSLEFHLHSNYNILSHTLDHHGQFALDEGLPVHFREKSAEGGKGKRKARKRQQEKNTNEACMLECKWCSDTSLLPHENFMSALCVWSSPERGISISLYLFSGLNHSLQSLMGSCVLYKACRLAIY